MTIEQLQELVEGNLPDNRIGAITPFKHRAVWQALLDYMAAQAAVGEPQTVVSVIPNPEVLTAFSDPIGFLPAPPTGFRRMYLQINAYLDDNGVFETNVNAEIQAFAEKLVEMRLDDEDACYTMSAGLDGNGGNFSNSGLVFQVLNGNPENADTGEGDVIVVSTFVDYPNPF